MKLELKHLAPYLPYRLKFGSKEANNFDIELEIISIENFNEKGVYLKTSIDGDFHYSSWTNGWGYKPILRPLSDLTKSELIELRFDDCNVTLLWGANVAGTYDNFMQFYEKDLTYSVLEWLYEKHFDVFGLIEKGLAIDINTLENE